MSTPRISTESNEDLLEGGGSFEVLGCNRLIFVFFFFKNILKLCFFCESVQEMKHLNCE